VAARLPQHRTQSLSLHRQPALLREHTRNKHVPYLHSTAYMASLAAACIAATLPPGTLSPFASAHTLQSAAASLCREMATRAKRPRRMTQSAQMSQLPQQQMRRPHRNSSPTAAKPLSPESALLAPLPLFLMVREPTSVPCIRDSGIARGGQGRCKGSCCLRLSRPLERKS
jgi:hypothetical protein